MSFIRENDIQSVRKARPCAGCNRLIEVGTPARQWVGVVDGDFMHNIYHRSCRQAEVELNELHEWRWNDDWMMLFEIEWEDYPWLIEKYPLIAFSMGITQERYDRVAMQHRNYFAR